MKKQIIIPMASFFVFGFYSCQENEPADFIEKTDPTGQTSGQKGGGIYAMHIDNGVDCNCENNILVFPDWETFRSTSDMLEDQWDQHVTSFAVNSPPELTDIEFEAYSDSLGFHEEQPYMDFEASYQFASLRNMLYDQETAWLTSLRQDEIWNAEEDPDNHYIWYENRALLNEQAEVIVKDSLGNDVIYKFYEGGHVRITGNNYEALQDFNTTGRPVSDPQVRYFFNPCIGDPMPEGSPDPWNNFPESPCYGSGSGGGGDDSEPVCKNDNDIRKYFSTGSDTKIKTVDKFHDATQLGGNKIKSKTKYYRWVNVWPFNGFWKRGKTTITARLEFDKGIECGTGKIFPPKYKTRKASKVKVKYGHNDLVTETRYLEPDIVEDAVYGIHKRRQDVTKKIDLYNGDVQP